MEREKQKSARLTFSGVFVAVTAIPEKKKARQKFEDSKANCSELAVSRSALRSQYILQILTMRRDSGSSTPSFILARVCGSMTCKSKAFEIQTARKNLTSRALSMTGLEAQR